MSWLYRLTLVAAMSACGPAVGDDDGGGGSGDGGTTSGSTSGSSNPSADATGGSAPGTTAPPSDESSTGPQGEMCPVGDEEPPTFSFSLGFPTGNLDSDNVCVLTAIDQGDDETSIDFECDDGNPGGARWSRGGLEWPAEVQVGADLQVRMHYFEAETVREFFTVRDSAGVLIVGGSGTDDPGNSDPELGPQTDWAPLQIIEGQTNCIQQPGVCAEWNRPGALEVTSASGASQQVFGNSVVNLEDGYALHTGALISDEGGESSCDGRGDRVFQFLVGRTG